MHVVAQFNRIASEIADAAGAPRPELLPECVTQEVWEQAQQFILDEVERRGSGAGEDIFDARDILEEMQVIVEGLLPTADLMCETCGVKGPGVSTQIVGQLDDGMPEEVWPQTRCGEHWHVWYLDI